MRVCEIYWLMHLYTQWHIEVMRPHLFDIGKFIIHVPFKWSIMVRILRIYNAEMTLLKNNIICLSINLENVYISN